MKRPIITLEDGTEVLCTTGDSEALEYGGGVFFRTSDRRSFFWTFWAARDRGEKNYSVFTARVPDDVISYFDPDTDEITSVCGIKSRELKLLSKSRNPEDRLQVVMAIRDCCGSSRVDDNHEPEVMSPWELTNKWGDVFGIPKGSVSMIDLEDFIIRETDDKQYECGTVDGQYLGKHRAYEEALTFIANHMQNYGMLRSNVFHEHDYGKLELLACDWDSYVKDIAQRKKKLSATRWRNHVSKYTRTRNQKVCIFEPKDVIIRRRRAANRLAQKGRIERARSLRRSLEDAYEE